jgi:hypothetical protein
MIDVPAPEQEGQLVRGKVLSATDHSFYEISCGEPHRASLTKTLSVPCHLSLFVYISL